MKIYIYIKDDVTELTNNSGWDSHSAHEFTSAKQIYPHILLESLSLVKVCANERAVEFVRETLVLLSDFKHVGLAYPRSLGLACSRS